MEKSKIWRKVSPHYVPARKLADRHYSRKTPGALGFMPPGRKLVLYRENAVWGTSWPFPEYTTHGYGDAFVCTIFRNESEYLSSDMIKEALACSRWYWGCIPEAGMITFIDTKKVKAKRDPGYCYIKAGFKSVGKTKARKLRVLQLLPDEFPEPMQIKNMEAKLF